MTIKEVNEMKTKGFENYEREKLMEGYVLINTAKNTFADLEKNIKTAIEDKMDVGDQLSLDFGTNTFTSKVVEVNDINFDCSMDDLYAICASVASMYCTHGVNKTQIKSDYIKGTLHPDITKHLTVVKQQEMKFTKKSKKGDE